MKPVKLELVLENCETIVFDWKHVNGMHISDISTSEQIDDEGNIVEYRQCMQFHIDVDSSGGEYEFENGSAHWGKRLEQYGDITQVNIVYKDGSRRECRVRWSPEWCGYHPWQGVEHDSEGYSYIWCNRLMAKVRDIREEMTKNVS